jgi:hypothetical protein
MPASFRCHALAYCLFSAAWVPGLVVHGIPYSILRNKATKCFKLESIAPETTVTIAFHAPGAFFSSFYFLFVCLSKPRMDTNIYWSTHIATLYTHSHTHTRVHLTYRGYVHTDLVLQETKAVVVEPADETITTTTPPPGRKKFGGMNIVATYREFEEHEADGSFKARPSLARERLQLEEMTGVMFFRTPDWVGYLEICVQCFDATYQTPSRISLNITSSEDSLRLYEAISKSNSMSEELRKRLKQSQQVLKTETSGITRELGKLDSLVASIFKQSQVSAGRNVEFQENSLKLNKAVRYWPMFRIVILMIGGYLQVSFVLDYMKRKHIY